MGKLLVRIVTIIAIVCSLPLISCEDEGCQESRIVKLNAAFYSIDSTYLVKINAVKINGLGHDSLLYDSVALSNFNLYLKSDTTTTAYVFDFPTMYYRDTIYIKHTNRDAVISMECGCTTFATIDSLYWTSHLIQKVTITNVEINTGNEENIRIYL